MRFRLSRALIFLLLFSAVLPPPRVLAFLVADAPRQGSGEPNKKTQQARGRNRISSPARQDACCSPARIAGGDTGRQPPMRFMARRDEPFVLNIRQPSFPPTIHCSGLHLRC